MRYFDHSLETMPRKAFQTLQIEKLRSMLQKIYGRNKFYTKKLDKERVSHEEIRTLDDLGKLPLTNKVELMQDQQDALPFGSNITFPEAAYTRFHQTSGTTGTP